ncbi:MAG: F0F1 ATP synthase subunit B [Anaerolineae bacterium]|nr:F0F1 ATP synthase subunit B [Anaerolineae bacterium]NUQ06203.1 F0F1 ATP synthase subunit B [Anaerolineae bacterium]
MQKRATLIRVILALALVLSLALSFTASAQEGAGEATAAEAEHSEAAPAEGEAAAAEASTNPLVPLGINTGFLLAQIVNFLLIFVLLSRLVWGPLMNMLDNRATTVQKGLEDAAEAARARRDAEADADKVLAAARAEAARIVEEARGRGEEVARGVETEARSEADSIRADARSRSEDERNRQLADLRGQVVAIAAAMSQRIIGETLDEKRQSALISDFFAKVPDAAKALGGSVEVVSAMPLSDAEQSSVKKQVKADNLTFVVDPSILGGLILRSEERVVDGSVRSNLSSMVGSLR